MTDHLSNTPVWEDAPPLRLPRLEASLSADVCVIGLGGSGLAAVHELLDAGASVVGLDASAVAAGAAGRNGGFLLAGLALFHHDAVARLGRERAARLYRLTLEQIERMAAETSDSVRLTGSLRIASCEEEERDCRAHLESLSADGLPGEWHEGPEGHGLLLPTDAVYQPLLRCRTLAAAAVARGARLHEHSPASDVEPGVVTVGDAIVHCDAVVVAVDGLLTSLLPELAPRVRPARLQMLATAPTREVRFDRPVYTRWGYDYWQQLSDGRLVLGGFRDRHEADEWTTSGEPSAGIQMLLEDFVRTRLGVSVPVTHRWAAVVSYSDTRLPVLEEVRPRVIAVGAYSGTGNVLGPLCARSAARLALGETSELERLLHG